MIPGKTYTPEIILQMIWRRKWLIFIPAVLIAVGGIAWTYRQVDLYRSEATILVMPQQVPQEYVRSTITTRIEDRLGAMQQQIMSRTKLERIVLDFNLYSEQRQAGAIMEDVVEQMRSDVTVQPIRGDAFLVGFRSQQPQLAMRVTERLASMFIDESMRDRSVLAEGTTQFLDSELEGARRSLQESETKVEQYRRAYNGQMPDQLGANQSTINSIQTQLQTLHMSLSQDRELQITLQQQLDNAETLDVTSAAAPPPLDYGAFVEAKVRNLYGPAAPTTAAEQLKVAQDKLQSARMRLKPEHPQIQILMRDVEKAQEAADAEAANVALTSPANAGLSPAEQARRNSIETGKQRLAALEKRINESLELEKNLRGVLANYQARVEGTPTREVEMTDLTRNYGILQQQYNSLLSKKQEAQISQNLERRQIGETFKILDAARLPSRPYYPDRPRYYVLAIVIGLAIGFGIAALIEYLDRTMRSEDDVRVALTLPVLAAIPLVADPAADRRRRMVALTASAVAVAMITVAAVAWKILLKG